MRFEKASLARPHLIVVPLGLEDNQIRDQKKLSTRFRFLDYTGSSSSVKQLTKHQLMFTDHLPERRWDVAITTPNCLRNRYRLSKHLMVLGPQGMDRRTWQQYKAQEPAINFEWNRKHQFEWLIVDVLKNADMKINRTVGWLSACYHVFVTSRPFYNRPDDIVGYQAVLQKVGISSPANIALLNDPAITPTTNPFTLAPTHPHYCDLIL